MPEDEAFTTQAAANYLGMSRPFLLRLLERGKIPFHKVGTHRRILLKDLLDFQSIRNRERSRALTELTQLMDEEGVYDRRLESDQ
jgi:excisionase family DNA binding protein